MSDLHKVVCQSRVCDHEVAPALLPVSGRQLCAYAMCSAQVASAHVNVHAVLCMCVEYRRGVHISLGRDMLASYKYMLVAI